MLWLTKRLMQLMKQKILICDKNGDLGNSVWQEFKDSFFCVLVSSKKPEGFVRNDDNLFIYYKKERKKLPVIPEYDYKHIVVFYNGEAEIKNSIQAFTDLAREKIILITQKSFAFDLWQKLENKKNASLCVLGDVFSKTILKRNRVEEILFEVKKNEVIEISGQGFDKVFPIYKEDVVNEITNLILNEKKHSGVFCLWQKDPPTELSFARTLQKINPDLKINFIENKNKPNPNSLEGEYCFFDDYLLKNRLKEVLTSGEFLETHDNFFDYTENKINKKKIISFALVIILILIFPFIVSILTLAIGSFELKKVKENIEIGNYKEGKKYLIYAQNIFALGNIFTPFVILESSYIGQMQKALQLSDSIAIGQRVSTTLLNLYEVAKNLAKVILGNSKNPENDFLIAQKEIKDILIELQQLKKESMVADEIKQKLENIKNQTTLFEQINEVLPQVLGMDRKKTYLLLFQNNMELRPTGGFIGSFATVSFDKGKMEGFLIEDVYESDGKLKGHIDPPLFLQKYMGAKHLFLRDSNYDIDFTKSATLSALLYKQESGVDVDGVIAFDMSVIKQILKVIGEVKVIDYDKIANYENVYQLTQDYTQSNFFPGSTQKKDFLRALLLSIQNKITNSNFYPKLIDAFYTSITEKHILFAFLNPDIQRPFSITGISSTLPQFMPLENKIINLVGINEANIGGNKVNYFINRKVSFETEINKEASISSKLKINYKNNAIQKEGQNLDYKIYIRFILPEDAKLDSIGINDKTTPFIITPNVKNNQDLEVDEYIQDNKKIYGFFLTVESNSEKKVAIVYHLKKNLQIGKTLSYKLYIIKQPGTEEDLWNISFSYPFLFSLLKKDDRLIQGENKVLSEFGLNKDTIFNFDLVRK